MAIAIILGIVFGICALAGLIFAIFFGEEGSPIAATLCGIAALAFLVSFVLVPFSFHQVNTGEVAVVREFGTIKAVKTPGLYYDGWIKNKYEKYDAKVKQIDMTSQAYTFDKQTVDLNFSMQYQIESASVDKLAEIYGSIDAVEEKIKNVTLDKVKAIFAQKTADQIIEDRTAIVHNVKDEVTKAINPETYYLTVKDIVLTNIDFTDDYEAAVAAKVAQKQAYEKALIEQEQALKQAENDKEVAIKKAQADAEASKERASAEAAVAKIKAEADAEVAKIEADAAEYQGKKDSAISMNKLAGVNGWYVVNITDDNGEVIGYKLMKSDGTLVSQEELAKGVSNLLEVYKYEKWDGKLPVYEMSDSGTVTVVTPTI